MKCIVENSAFSGNTLVPESDPGESQLGTASDDYQQLHVAQQHLFITIRERPPFSRMQYCLPFTFSADGVAKLMIY